MTTVEHRAKFPYSKFNRLGLGETFIFFGSQDICVKVSNDQYGLFAPSDSDAYRPVGAVVNSADQVVFYRKPTLTVFTNAQVTLAPNPSYPETIYSNSLPSGDFGFQGFDPMLGPPYPPVQYQLFVTPITSGQFANTNHSGPPVHLYWTVPSLAIQTVAAQMGNIHYYTVWGNTTNDITTAIPVVVGPTPNTAYMYSALYVWVRVNPGLSASPKATRPSAGTNGISVAPGFGGDIVPSGSSGSETVSFIPLVDTLSYFTLERSRGDSNFQDMINSFIPGPPRDFTIDDASDRDPSLSYWYRLTGHTAAGVIIPYNNVALIHPYTFNAQQVQVTGGVQNQLTWSAPTQAEIDAWPETSL